MEPAATHAWKDRNPSFNTSPLRTVFPPGHMDKESAALDPRYMTIQEQRLWKRSQVSDGIFDRIRRHEWPDSAIIDQPWRPQMLARPRDVASFLILRGNYVLNRNFPMFCQLPAKVRNRIWSQAVLDDPRVFEMRHPQLRVCLDDKGDREIRRRRLVKPRALAAACVESRLQFSEVEFGDGCYYLINFDADTIYFGPESYWYHGILWRPNHQDEDEATEWENDNGWVWTQSWNHWRYGNDNYERGEEQLRSHPYQNCYPQLSPEDAYHPFLTESMFDIERSQIKNVAFNIEFWEDTEKRRIGGQEDLISQFPCAERFVLAVGDIGESLDLRRTDGLDGMKTVCICRKDSYSKVNCPPGVKYVGQVDLHPGVNEDQLSEALKGQLGSGIPNMAMGGASEHPRLEVMYVSRGGKYRGHPRRVLGLPVPGDCGQEAGNDDDDNIDDLDDTDFTLWNIMENRLLDDPKVKSANYIFYTEHEDEDRTEDLLEDERCGRKIPSSREVEDLQDPERNLEELKDLEELKSWLNPGAVHAPKMTGQADADPKRKRIAFGLHRLTSKEVVDFHATSCLPADYDTVEEFSDEEDSEDSVCDVEITRGKPSQEGQAAKSGGSENTTVVNETGGEDGRIVNTGMQNKANKKAKTLKMSGEADINNGKDAELRKEKATTGYTRVPLKDPPINGERVGKILDSRVKYGFLAYKVDWESLEGRRRLCKHWVSFETKEGFSEYFDSDHAKKLIIVFHQSHPSKPSLETARKKERAKWGSRTGRLDVKTPRVPGPSQPSNASSSPALSADRSDEANEMMILRSGATSPLSSVSLSQMSTSVPLQWDDEVMIDTMVVQPTASTSLGQQQQLFKNSVKAELSMRNDTNTATSEAYVFKAKQDLPFSQSLHPRSSILAPQSVQSQQMDIDQSAPIEAAKSRPTLAF